MRADVLRIIDGFNREGMTGAKDVNVGQATFDLYKQLLDEGKLTVRVAALWRGGNTVESARQAMAPIRVTALGWVTARVRAAASTPAGNPTSCWRRPPRT